MIRGAKSMKELLRRLIQWLKDHGHNADEVLECLNYILGK